MRTLITSLVFIITSLVIFTGCTDDKKSEEAMRLAEEARMDSIAQWKIDSINIVRVGDSLAAEQARLDSIENASTSTSTSTSTPRSTPPSGGTKSTPTPTPKPVPKTIPTTDKGDVKVIVNEKAPPPAAPKGDGTTPTKQTKPGTPTKTTTKTQGGSTKSTSPGGIQGKTEVKPGTVPSGKTSKPGGDIKSGGN